MGRKLQSEYPYLSPKYNRDKNLLSKYGISLTDWNTLFLSQGSKCAICHSTEPRGRNWHTDHNHSSGKIRGILCGPCNSGIGKLQEDWRLFLKSAAYCLVSDYSEFDELKIAKRILETCLEIETNGKGHEGHSSEATEGGPQKEPSSTGRTDQAWVSSTTSWTR